MIQFNNEQFPFWRPVLQISQCIYLVNKEFSSFLLPLNDGKAVA